MKNTTLILNLVQMVIVLAVFLFQGISLGGWTILALFVLLIIACVNLVFLLFYGEGDQAVIKAEKKAIVKRQDLRVSYGAGTQPVMVAGGQEYPILDIAESGVRISVGRHDRLKKRSKCHINLLSGDVVHAKAVVLRRNGDEAALAFKPPIEYAYLLREKQAVAGSVQG